jgi:hypothetical protein
MMQGWPGNRAKGVAMDNVDNGLADEEKSFIVPLIGVGSVFIFILLVKGLFMPTTQWLW